LFERITTQDPTALIGLPLIALCRLLGKAGIDVI
jgi:septum formation protein